MARRILASLALTLGLVGTSGAAAQAQGQGTYVGPSGTMITGGSQSTGTAEVYFNRGDGQVVILVMEGNTPSTFMRISTAPTDDGTNNCATFGRGC